jgi:hypothetical protein
MRLAYALSVHLEDRLTVSDYKGPCLLIAWYENRIRIFSAIILPNGTRYVPSV